jgi:hypothetical protein
LTHIQDCLTEAGAEYMAKLKKDPSERDRSRLGVLEQQNALESYLERRFAFLSRASEIRSQTPRFDSLFLTDHRGTMIAWTSSDELAISRVGSNFAYRDYFNGLADDADPGDPNVVIGPVEQPHLSSPFLSTTTNRWKIAVSTPVWETKSEDNQSGITSPKILGVLVLTIQLGDLDLLPRDMPQSSSRSGGDNLGDAQNRLAVLVDGHSGSKTLSSEGTILQHIGFSENLWNSVVESDKTFRIDPETLRELKQGGTDRYIDPLSQHPDCSSYAGNWIAAMARVEIPNKLAGTAGKAESSNLWVLVQARTDSVTEPVAQMARQMIWEGIIATLILIVLVFSLWAIVVWGMRLPENFRAVIRSQPLTSDRTNATEDITIDANR